MYVVFVVGGIGSGKSTVAKHLVSLGATRIDLDQVSRDVLLPGTACLAALAQEFGSDILTDETGELNRALLAERAFANSEATTKLEEIEHPFIKAEFIRQLELLREQESPVPICVVEIPLLDRALDLLPHANEVIAVVAPVELRRKRAIERGMSAEDFDHRILSQPSDSFLLQYANYMIENTGSLEYLIERVDSWWQEAQTRLATHSQKAGNERKKAE